MKLNGAEQRKLYEALLDGYRSHNALRRMVKFQLDENLNAFAKSEILNDVVFELIDWAEAHGKLERLIIGAYEENPDNLSLKEFHQKYFPFSEAVSVLSSEDWTEIQLVLSEIDWDLLEQTCRETLKGIAKNIEDNLPQIINIKSLPILKEILIEKYPYKNKVPTVLEFAERLTNNKIIATNAKIKIKNWLGKIAKEKNITLPTYTETQPYSITANSYLLIAIEKESEVSDNFILQAELIPNYQEREKLSDAVSLALTSDGLITCSLENIKNTIYEFIKAAKVKLIKEYKYSSDNLTIELFLPLKYLGQHFDLAEIPAGLNKFKPIGYQYRLVTRCRERYLLNEDTNWGDFFIKFENRWNFWQNFLKNNPVEIDIQDKFLYLENDQITEIEQWDEFSKASEWEESQKLAVNAIGSLSKNDCQEKFFECLLRGGIPVSLWHGCSQLSCSEVREKFKQILAYDSLQDWSKLLTKVFQVRRDETLGYHLGFLCEHGSRIPSVLNPYQGGDLLMGSD